MRLLWYIISRIDTIRIPQWYHSRPSPFALRILVVLPFAYNSSSLSQCVDRLAHFFPDFLMPWLPLFIGPFPPAFFAISSRAFLSVIRKSAQSLDVRILTRQHTRSRLELVGLVLVVLLRDLLLRLLVVERVGAGLSEVLALRLCAIC